MNEHKRHAEDRAPGLLRRVGAMLYDTATVLALDIVVHILVVLTAGAVMGVERFDAEALGRSPLYLALLLALPALFFLGFWTKGGQTLGMRAWRIRVVRADGSPLGPRHALGRLGAALLSWLFLGAGFLWVLVDRDKAAWHDRLSGTRLVMQPRDD
jgi:uncharacterized RDD family membrane protein YckC